MRTFLPFLVTAFFLATSPAAIGHSPILEPGGQTVLFAQVVAWLDDSHFVVGRWDGSITIFRTPSTGEFGPVITEAMAEPSGAGVEMLIAYDDTTLVTSDGRSSLAIWRRNSGAPAGTGFALAGHATYDPTFGPADSSLTINIGGTLYLITGHENGSLVLWAPDSLSLFKIYKTIDLRSPNPPSNPWGIHNVRGLAKWRSDIVVTGSEDGDLVGIHLLDGVETFRSRYNSTAQRGINSISVIGDWLLVANCAVGNADNNLWLFDLRSGSPVISDKYDLVLDGSRAQVFDFDAMLAQEPSGLEFFASTEEGLIWQGFVENGQLMTTAVTKSSPEGGSAMSVSPTNDFLAAATYTLRLFKLH